MNADDVGLIVSAGLIFVFEKSFADEALGVDVVLVLGVELEVELLDGVPEIFRARVLRREGAGRGRRGLIGDEALASVIEAQEAEMIEGSGFGVG